MTRSASDRHSDFLPYLLNRVVSQLNTPMQKMLHKRAMTLTHWRILGILDESDGLTISALSERTVTDHATLSRALDRLEQRDMVRRVVDSTDSRQVRVRLLASGRRENREIAAYAHQVQAWAFRDLSEAQRDRLQRALNVLSDSMHESHSPEASEPSNIRVNQEVV